MDKLKGILKLYTVSPNKMCVTIDTMLNFDGDFGGHNDGDFTCSQTLRPEDAKGGSVCTSVKRRNCARE